MAKEFEVNITAKTYADNTRVNPRCNASGEQIVAFAPGSGSAATIANGADVAEGATTDVPVADNTTVASATPATVIGSLKRLVNLFIAVLAKLPALGTAGTASANVITVQGIAAGVPLPISGSFTIPAFDYQAFTYIAATNNIATQVFKTGGSAGTTVATLTFTYVAAGAADNDKIASITRS